MTDATNDPTNDTTNDAVGDLLRIDGHQVDCVIGVYAEERPVPQPLVVSLGLTLDTRRAARDEDLAATVDYARLLGAVRFVLQQGAFLLIETAAEVVANTVLATVNAEHIMVHEVTVTLQKPRALAGNGVPALSITRRLKPARERWTVPGGVVDVLHRGQHLTLSHLRLDPRHALAMAGDVTAFAIDDDRHGRDGGAVAVVDNATDLPRCWLLAARPTLSSDAFTAAALPAT